MTKYHLGAKTAGLAGSILVVAGAMADDQVCPALALGAGTPASPCEISTAEQLAGIQQEPELHYVLVADINLKGFGSPRGLADPVWMPINNFAGVLDGQDHTISNLFSDQGSSGQGTGLFGTSDYPFTIRNVHLVDANVLGGSRTGVLFGRITHEDALIENVTATGQVTSTGWRTGGLVGANSGIIVNAQVHVDVLMEGEGSIDGVGGLVGGNSRGEIRDSLATGSVTSHGRSAVGGLVGYNYEHSHVENSRATGDVTHINGSSGTGGLAGWNFESSIVNAHATGNVTAENTNDVGGLVGDMGATASIETGSAAGAVTGDRRVGGLIGRVSDDANLVSDVRASGNVTGNDFVGGLIGTMGDTVLKGQIRASGDVKGTDYAGGLIGRLHDFTEEQDHDIDQAYASGNVEGHNYVGGLIGSFEQFSGIHSVQVTLSNVYATGNVNATGDMIGGLIGTIWPWGDSMLYLQRAYAAGKVSGGTSVGGLVGYNLGEVTESYWDTDTSGLSAGAGFNDNLFAAEGMSTSEMQQQTSFEGWNFSTVWSIREGEDYPRLFDIVFADRFKAAPP